MFARTIVCPLPLRLKLLFAFSVYCHVQVEDDVSVECGRFMSFVIFKLVKVVGDLVTQCVIKNDHGLAGNGS